jgi:epoxyqueuosine reductase
VTLSALALAGAVKARARELGFDAAACGPARVEHGEAFARWLDAGHAAGMGYLARTRAERLDPGRLLPGARSVVAVALAYGPEAGAADDPRWRGVSRYARGRDYHDVMRPRLERLAAFIDATAGEGTRSRAAVDTSAVLERDLAAAAGLGWIGRSTMLLSERLGSWFFIGLVLTTAALAPDARAADRCGTCTACLDACPTQAFPAPRVLDARRCLSYLTIEHRGDVDEALRGAGGEWLFGCDVCQDVCPWNRKAPPGREPSLAPGAPPPPPEALLALDEAGFRERFRGTPLRRAGRRGLLRNAALVLGRRGDARARPALARAAADGDEVVRRAAGWALARLPS